MSVYDKLLDDVVDDVVNSAKQNTEQNFDMFGMFADWAEDNQRQALADCLRWQMENKKRPYISQSDNNKGASWFNEEGGSVKDIGDPGSNLPKKLYDALADWSKVSKANHRKYETPRAALEALFAAWEKVNAVPAPVVVADTD